MRRMVRAVVLPGAAVLVAVYALISCGSDGSTDYNNGIDRIPPPAPDRIQVDKIRDGEVWLSWPAVVDDADAEPAYVVYRADGDAAAVSVDTTYRTSFQDVGLDYETEYTYYVTARDAAGNLSTPSMRVSGQPFNNLAPLAPTGLRAFAHNLALFAQLTVDIALDWDANVEADLSAYRVYRGTEPGFPIGAGAQRTETPSPRFVDEDVTVGTSYFYKVTAVDRGGKESPVSLEVSDTPVLQTQLLEPIEGELTSTVPTFTWNRIPAAITYQVIVTTSPTSGEISAVPLTADTTATFRGRAVSGDRTYQLESGELYYWKVIASTRSNGQENSVSSVESFKVR
jgi:cellulose 1,4-beta-cellobiosidase